MSIRITVRRASLRFLAAQFFWQKGLKEKTIRDTSQYYKIAVGKYTRDISEIDNGSTQIADVSGRNSFIPLIRIVFYNPRVFYTQVKQIHLEDSFRDAEGYYGNDIAIVVLKTAVVTSDAVMPVCLDWNKKFTIPNGSVGKVPTRVLFSLPGLGNCRIFVYCSILRVYGTPSYKFISRELKYEFSCVFLPFSKKKKKFCIFSYFA